MSCSIVYVWSYFWIHKVPTAFFQLLLAKDLETVLALSSVCISNNDRSPLATALLQTFRHERQESHLLKTLNDLEIDKEGA